MIRNSVPGKELTNRSGELSALRRRVLVADDQPRMLDVIAAMVGKSYDVGIGLVSDGPATLEATLKLEPDLVILDISMPGMSGIEVARELREARQ